MLDTWMPEEFYLDNRQDLESLVGQRTGLLDSLVKAKIPAIIFRSVYDPSDCVSLIQRFTDIGLIRDSRHLDQSQYWINKNINTTTKPKSKDSDVFNQWSVRRRGARIAHRGC